MSPASPTRIVLVKGEDRPSPDDALANVEEHLLACCRAFMFANPLMAFSNAMLTGFVMSRLRRIRRRN
jgi:hypothetical protein